VFSFSGVYLEHRPVAKFSLRPIFRLSHNTTPLAHARFAGIKNSDFASVGDDRSPDTPAARSPRAPRARAAASREIPMICSSLNSERLIVRLLSGDGGVYASQVTDRNAEPRFGTHVGSSTGRQPSADRGQL
jgi:hypothetical protein